MPNYTTPRDSIHGAQRRPVATLAPKVRSWCRVLDKGRGLREEQAMAPGAGALENAPMPERLVDRRR